MNYITAEISALEKRGITTEILFNIATARNSETKLIRFNIKNDNLPKLIKNVIVALKKAKKSDLIDTYVPLSEIRESNTAAIYLLNKFPFLSKEEASESYYTIFVKI